MIKVRSITRRTIDERWNADAIKDIKATTRHPNPKDPEQHNAMPEGQTTGIEVGGDGSKIVNNDLCEDAPKAKLRDFKINKPLLVKFGHRDDCKGCHFDLHGGTRRQHSQA